MSRLLVRWSGRTRLLTSSSGMPSNLSCFFLSLYVFARFLASASSALRKKKNEHCEGLNNTAGFLYAASYDSVRKARSYFSRSAGDNGGLFPRLLFADLGSRLGLTTMFRFSWHHNAMLRFVENSYCEYARIIYTWINWYLARYKTTVDAIYGCCVFKRQKNRLTQ